MKALDKGSIASIVQVGLQIARIVLWVAAGALGLAIAAYLLFLALAGLGVVDPSTIPPVDRGDGHGIRIQISGIDSGDMSEVIWTDWQIFIPALLAGSVTVGGSLVIVQSLLKLFESFSSGEPFRRSNAKHLRVIWITMVVIELSRYAIMALIGAILGVFGAPESLDRASFSIDSNNLSTWMSILILIVLAEVFREGARLKEEQELTI